MDITLGLLRLLSVLRKDTNISMAALSLKMSYSHVDNLVHRCEGMGFLTIQRKGRICFITLTPLGVSMQDAATIILNREVKIPLPIIAKKSRTRGKK